MQKQWKQWETLFSWAPKSLGTATKLKDPWLLRRKAMTNLDSILKSRDITLWTKVPKVFPVIMHGCESWTIKKAERRRIDAFKLVLEKTLESPLECKDIKPVNSKRNQPWIFIGNRWGNSGWFYFGAPKSLQMVIAAMKLKAAYYSLEGKLWPT